MEGVSIELEHMGTKGKSNELQRQTKGQTKGVLGDPAGYGREKRSLDEGVEICIFISSFIDPGRNRISGLYIKKCTFY